MIINSRFVYVYTSASLLRLGYDLRLPYWKYKLRVLIYVGKPIMRQGGK